MSLKKLIIITYNCGQLQTTTICHLVGPKQHATIRTICCTFLWLLLLLWLLLYFNCGCYYCFNQCFKNWIELNGLTCPTIGRWSFLSSPPFEASDLLNQPQTIGTDGWIGKPSGSINRVNRSVCSESNSSLHFFCSHEREIVG